MMTKKLGLALTLFLLTQSNFLFAESHMIDVDQEINYNDPWYNKNKTEEENFKKILMAIAKSSSGKTIIQKATDKAAERGLTLIDVLASGDGSLTDTTLVRRFQASDPTNVAFETRSKVYINRHLKTLDAMLDLSHELTHFTYREAFNPYDHRFKLKDFIKTTVEGRGGEVDAYLVECKVLQELLPGEVGTRSNCTKVYDKKSGTLSKERGIEEFYKVGSHIRDFQKDLDKFSLDQNEIPKISGDDATFISSAWGLPYPVAAVKEYQNIMDRVCKNDQNRLGLLQTKIDRAPAQVGTEVGTSSSTRLKTMFEDYKIRCQMFNKNS
jgi:hypothetical protein